MLSEIRTGPIIGADGAVSPARAGRFGDTIVNAAGDYAELARNGQLFMAAMQAGASLGTALTATAVTFTLYNPSGSTIIPVLLECSAVITTLPGVAAGANVALVYAANVDASAAVPATLTNLTVRNALLGMGAGQAKAFSAATLPAAPVIVRVHPLGLNNQTAVGDAQLAGCDKVQGAIALLPNTAITLQAIGTASSGIISMLWAEIPR